MLKNVTNLIVAATYIVLTIVLSQSCYAGITKENVEIPCSDSIFNARWKIYKGDGETKMALITLGIAVAGEEKLVSNWGYEREGDASISAKCIDGSLSSGVGMDGRGSIEMMPAEPEDDEFVPETMPSIVCPAGKNMAVRMNDPSDPNPDKYKYIGELIKITSEITEEELQSQVSKEVLQAIRTMEEKERQKKVLNEIQTNIHRLGEVIRERQSDERELAKINSSLQSLEKENKRLRREQRGCCIQ